MTPSARGSPHPDVAAVIAAHNEAANIEDCIAALDWAKEVIVVENDSADDTVARAHSAGATVISPRFTTIGEPCSIITLACVVSTGGGRWSCVAGMTSFTWLGEDQRNSASAFPVSSK